MLITILIPTRNRPRPLARALASVAALTVPEGAAVEVLVADNSADFNARTVVEEAAPPFSVTTIHVPRPGVATVRNAGVAAAKGDLVAFLDDDCEADPGWLAAQVATLAATGADGSFGPRIARIAEDGPRGGAAGAPDAALIASTYSRDLHLADGADVTDRDAHLPLPGAVFLAARCLAMRPGPFDPRLDSIGAEDVLLFRQLREAGRRFVWSPGARVVEEIPAARANPSFVMRRRYVSGQHRCIVPMMLEPPRRGEMLGHMLKGGAALAVAAPLALAGRGLTGRWPERATGLTMSGLGKLTWWRRNGPALYGQGHR
ncbi:glycosyltransferase family 2 protein [Acuticoccus yangtzensis]|uniref:glycosyltransferase family 2 protein n=1 Tax=Acuticoccus yangtzensis TaxID=1443441 RepID=UPI0009495D58|nr:glycosyltransferase family 2 protein [Acuticoccus yangtzensis]